MYAYESGFKVTKSITSLLKLEISFFAASFLRIDDYLVAICSTLALKWDTNVLSMLITKHWGIFKISFFLEE